MIQVKFKNLKKSKLAQEAVTERVSSLVDKFEALRQSQIVVTLEMENSPLQAGPDLFNVHLRVSGGKFNGVTIKKSDPNLYVALADLVDNMLEKLNRTGDKIRVKQRTKIRNLMDNLSTEKAEEGESSLL